MMRARQQEGELLSPKEVAALMKVSPRTVLEWVRANRVEHVRVGRETIRVWWPLRSVST